MKDYEEHVINLGPHNLVLIKAKRGYIMCGLLDIDVAEKLGHIACMVSGVSIAEDVLEVEIQSCTSKAKALGIVIGMTGRQALDLLS